MQRVGWLLGVLQPSVTNSCVQLELQKQQTSCHHQKMPGLHVGFCFSSRIHLSVSLHYVLPCRISSHLILEQCSGKKQSKVSRKPSRQFTLFVGCRGWVLQVTHLPACPQCEDRLHSFFLYWSCAWCHFAILQPQSGFQEHYKAARVAAALGAAFLLQNPRDGSL